MNVRTSALTVLLLFAPGLALHAQTPGSNIAPQGDHGGAPTKTFPIDQIVTASVHDAWLLSDKNEATFFDIVQQLAALSAEKRGIVLPESAEAGRRMGNYIKTQARADHDQLLYAVVDKAVRMVGKPQAAR